MNHARWARAERTKAETAAIIAAAAAAQKAAEERALMEAATAAEEQNKEEERRAERDRRRKERKEREEKRHGREDSREKRLLKLVGAVVVKTMSKYRTRMDIDTFKKHAKEVRPGESGTLFGIFASRMVFYSITAHAYHRGKGEKVIEL